MGKRGPQPIPMQELLFWEGLWYWVFHHLRGDSAPSQEKLARRVEIKRQLRSELEELGKLVPKDDDSVPEFQKRQIEQDLKIKPSDAEPAVWRALVAARTTADVQRACRASEKWLNPEFQGRPYVQDLNDHASEFVRAKTQNPYYPRRELGDEKRITFFARAMSGVSLGISPNTAIDRLRKYQHGRKCPCVHCDLKRWDRVDDLIYSVFFEKESDNPQKKLKHANPKKAKSRR
jgi:hypothetical protein